VSADPVKLPTAATPAFATAPTADPIPYTPRLTNVPPRAPAIAPNRVPNIVP